MTITRDYLPIPEGGEIISSVKSLPESVKKRALILVKKAFDQIPIETAGPNGDPYVRFSLTDGRPPIQPGLIEALCLLIINEVGAWENIDGIISEMDQGGGIVAAPLAYLSQKVLFIANSEIADKPTDINWPADIKFNINPHFSKSRVLLLNSVKPGHKLLVVDDLISSGQTLVGLIQAIQKLGGIVSDAICIGEEIDQNGRAFVKKTTGITVKTFVKYRTKDLKYTQVI